MAESPTGKAAVTGDVLKDISHFKKDALQHVKTAEKVVLPDAKVIDKEKKEKSVLDEIQREHNLSPTETTVHIHLPTAEEIKEEKEALKKQ